MDEVMVDAGKNYCEYKSGICIRNNIFLNDLLSLIAGEIAAIHVKDFCNKKVCIEMSNKLLGHSNRGSFNKAYDINRVGMAHFEIDNEESFRRYHENAVKHTQDLRESFNPYISPSDKIRLILEEVWPSGAYLETLYGKKCFVGICRIIEPTVELLAHNDRLDRDSPESQKAISLLAQLSACVYLQVPDIGGGLRLWLKEPVNEDEYKKLKGGSYGISLEKISPPDYVIEPQQGDLIIFNARKFHGVAPGVGKARINVGVFIGYRGLNYPLSYWS